MKTKIILSLLSTLYLFLSETSAQTTQLWNINLNFCNSWEATNELDLTTKAWEEVPICINLTNTDPEDITLNIDFLDAGITQDNNKSRYCNAADRPKLYFGNFMLDYEKTLTVKWNSSLQKTYKIRPPAWYKWISHGCIAYNQINTQKNNETSILNVVVRKPKFIDIFVWDTPIKSQIEIWSIKRNQSWKITNFQIWLKNIWNTEQNASISWTISNIFWFKETLILNQNNINITPNGETIIQTNNENLTLPTYKWFFTVNFEISNKPIFNFNISPENNIPKEVILGWHFKISKTFFIANRYFVWILIIFLILIYIAFFKKRKPQIIINPEDKTTNPQSPTNN